MKKISKNFFYNKEDDYEGSFSKRTLKAHTYQFPINESEEFYDPFSDISLFLAKKIKTQILQSKKKNWNSSIQKALIKDILPEFVHKFPKYHLRISALQKTFDKVQYYIKTLKQKGGQITPAGKINLHKVIRENLSQANTDNQLLHPFNLSHSIAVRISECIATVDNTRANIVELTKIIWSGQKNLILKKNLKTKCPFETFSDEDKLIARLQIESSIQKPHLIQRDLKDLVRKKMTYLQQIRRMRCKNTLRSIFWATLAHKTNQDLEFHTQLPKEIQEKILALFTKITNQRESHCKKHHAHAARAIEFLFQLSSAATLKEAFQELTSCIQYILDLECKKIIKKTRVMRSEIFDLLHQEIDIQKDLNSSEAIAKNMLEHFDEVKAIGNLSVSIIQELPLVYFNSLNHTLGPLKGVSKMMQDTVFNEICYQKLQDNNLFHVEAIEKSIDYIQAQDIQINGILKAIHPWTLQNDMIYCYLHFNESHTLFTQVKRCFQDDLIMTKSCLDQKLSQITDSYLNLNPQLKPYKMALLIQITIYFKAIYYNSFEDLTPYQLFLQYHFMQSLGGQQDEFLEVQITGLLEQSEQMTPLMPFSRSQIRHLIDDVKKKLRFA
jgi:hypothetical protein